MQDLQDYVVYTYETLIHIILPVCSLHAGRRIDKTISIVDLKGVKLTKIFDQNMKKFLQILSSTASNYYPELLQEMYIVNAPLIFAGIWKIIKLWIDKDIQKKIHIYSGIPHNIFVNLFQPESMPSFFKGSCQDELSDDPGPWREELIGAR